MQEQKSIAIINNWCLPASISAHSTEVHNTPIRKKPTSKLAVQKLLDPDIRKKFITWPLLHVHVQCTSWPLFYIYMHILCALMGTKKYITSIMWISMRLSETTRWMTIMREWVYQCRTSRFVLTLKTRNNLKPPPKAFWEFQVLRRAKIKPPTSASLSWNGGPSPIAEIVILKPSHSVRCLSCQW